MSISTIQRLLNILEKNITQINPTLDYNRVVRALELLGRAVKNYSGDNDDWIYLNEFTYGVDAFIVGGYWHLTEWHGGQASDTYRAMCSLYTVFSPGMTNGPEPESCEEDIYKLLDQLANEESK